MDIPRQSTLNPLAIAAVVAVLVGAAVIGLPIGGPPTVDIACVGAGDGTTYQATSGLTVDENDTQQPAATATTDTIQLAYDETTVTVSGSDAAVGIERATGGVTCLSGIETRDTTVEISPEETTDIAVAGEIDGLAFREPVVDPAEETADIAYNATAIDALTVDVDLDSEHAVAAIDADNGTVYDYGVVSDGTVRFESLPAGEEAIQLERRSQFAGGNGSIEAPFLIDNWHHLDTVRHHPDASFRLNQTLDADTAGYDLHVGDDELANDGRGFEPIGEDSEPFRGQFDGGDHTIETLHTDRPTESAVGLFGVGEDAHIERVRLSNATITGDSAVGGVVGVLQVSNNHSETDATIETTSVHGAITATDGDYTGGLVGLSSGGGSGSAAYGPTLNNSNSVRGTINGTEQVGGLVGRSNHGTTLGNSYVQASVTGSDEVGGLVGHSSLNPSRFEAMYFAGTASARGGDVGAIVGFVGDDGEVGDGLDTFPNIYWDRQQATVGWFGATAPRQPISDRSEANQPDGYLTADLQGSTAPTTMSGFDFTSQWQTVPGGYPVFQREPQDRTQPDELLVPASVTATAGGGSVPVVAFEDGVPAADAEIEITGDQADIAGVDAGETVTTDRNGWARITFTEQEAGIYPITIGAVATAAQAETTITVVGNPDKLAELDAENVTVPEDVAGSIPVELRDRYGNPVSGQPIEVVDEDGVAGLEGGTRIETAGSGTARFAFTAATAENHTVGFRGPDGLTDTATITAVSPAADTEEPPAERPDTGSDDAFEADTDDPEVDHTDSDNATADPDSDADQADDEPASDSVESDTDADSTESGDRADETPLGDDAPDDADQNAADEDGDGDSETEESEPDEDEDANESADETDDAEAAQADGDSGTDEPEATEVSILESTDEDAAGAIDDSEMPGETSVSVSNPEPGQVVVIENGETRVVDDFDELAPVSAISHDDTAATVRTDRLAVEIDTEQDFELAVSTYDEDLTPSETIEGEAVAAVNPVASSGTPTGGEPATVGSGGFVTPTQVQTAADSLSAQTSTSAVGYISIEHSLEPAAIREASVAFSVSRDHLDGVGTEPEEVTLYHQPDPDEWTIRETTAVDTDDVYHQFSGTTPEFSVLAITTGGPTIGATDLDTESGFFDFDNETDVTATIENYDQDPTEETIELVAGDEVLDTETISVAGGDSEQVSLTTAQNGTHTLMVGETTLGEIDVEQDQDASLAEVVLLLLLSLIVSVVIVAGVGAAILYWDRREPQ